MAANGGGCHRATVKQHVGTGRQELAPCRNVFGPRLKHRLVDLLVAQKQGAIGTVGDQPNAFNARMA